MRLIRKRPVLSYFLITFAVSWGAILILIALRGMPATVEQLRAQMPVAILAYLGGPTIAGLLMIGLVDGRGGYRDLLIRIIKWRVGVIWYAIALLTAPLVFLATHSILSLLSPAYQPGFLSAPNGSSLIVLGIVAGIMVGICEELGWFGFAIPKLRQRYGAAATGLIVGVVWGAWHIMSNDVWGIRAYSGGLSPILYATLVGLSFLIGQLPAFRILMVWVYERTGSLLVMILMHFSLTACSIAFAPTAMSFVQIILYGLTVATVMWLVAGAVLVAHRGRLEHRPEWGDVRRSRARPDNRQPSI